MQKNNKKNNNLNDLVSRLISFILVFLLFLIFLLFSTFLILDTATFFPFFRLLSLNKRICEKKRQLFMMMKKSC